MKSIARKVLRKAGYEVHRRTVYPYVRQHSIQGYSFRFRITDEKAREWYDSEGWDKVVETEELARISGPSSRILELGCHHGFMTTFLGTVVGTNGFVLGVDALPENCLIAQSQIALNDLTGMCCILNAAASNHSGKLTIVRKSNSHISTEQEVDTIIVNAVTGDALWKAFGPFDVLKIDVEGFECLVLEGCQEILSHRPKLALEIHGRQLARYGSNIASILDMIHIADYEGTMFTRPEYFTLRPFDAQSLSSDSITNVFLYPR